MSSKSEEKLWVIVENIYRKLYQATTPKGDWEQMKESGETQKEGFFNNYTISEKRFLEILNEEINNRKLSKFDIERIKATVYLGCSPKFEK